MRWTPIGDTMYEWMFRTETDDHNLDILLDIRRGIEELSPLNASFQLSRVTDYHPTTVEDPFLHVLGSWRLPDRYASRVVRYVNPKHIHKTLYADVTVRCECGALVFSEYGNDGHNDASGHTPDCRAEWRRDARERLSERRVDWVRAAAYYNLTQDEAAARVGLSRSSFASLCASNGIEWERLRRESGRRHSVETWQHLHNEYGESYRKIAEAFDMDYSALRTQVYRHE